MHICVCDGMHLSKELLWISAIRMLFEGEKYYLESICLESCLHNTFEKVNGRLPLQVPGFVCDIGVFSIKKASSCHYPKEFDYGKVDKVNHHLA